MEGLAARLRPLERSTCPFTVQPATNEGPHWVEPRLVAEVRFDEWTREGRMRYPVYLGRDFTVRTMPSRLRAVGDRWAVLRRARGAHLSALLRRAR